MSDTPIDVLVVGLGNMGLSHALAYHRNPAFTIKALVNRSAVTLPSELTNYPLHNEYYQALDSFCALTESTDTAQLVSINTYSDSHAEYAVEAMQRGAHVFVEKPIATTVTDADRVLETATRLNRKLVVGYILRHHPSWIKLIDEARALGGPYVFRLNLNQQSSGDTWATHKQLMQTTSPIVDCGVHYVDVMCQITDARPVRVNGIGVRLSEDIAEDMYNYGHFQVQFSDGSVGWYEAGWGPMMSETAYFVKDIVSPNGSVSIIMDEGAKSDDIDTHTRTAKIRIHAAKTDQTGKFINPDQNLSMQDEPDHQALCEREQAFVQQAINNDLDLTRHMQDARKSLAVCLAADQSIRTGEAVTLDL